MYELLVWQRTVVTSGVFLPCIIAAGFFFMYDGKDLSFEGLDMPACKEEHFGALEQV